MIGVASAESTAIGDPLGARKNRGIRQAVWWIGVVSTVLWRGCVDVHSRSSPVDIC